MSYALFEGLVRWDVRSDDFAIRPAAAALPVISDDRLTYTFTLRDDARWSNGHPLTTHDFVYSWMRLLLPDTAADYTSLIFCIRGAEPFWYWRRDQLAAFTADPWTCDPDDRRDAGAGVARRLRALLAADDLPPAVALGTGDHASLRRELDDLERVCGERGSNRAVEGLLPGLPHDPRPARAARRAGVPGRGDRVDVAAHRGALRGDGGRRGRGRADAARRARPPHRLLPRPGELRRLLPRLPALRRGLERRRTDGGRAARARLGRPRGAAVGAAPLGEPQSRSPGASSSATSGPGRRRSSATVPTGSSSGDTSATSVSPATRTSTARRTSGPTPSSPSPSRTPTPACSPSSPVTCTGSARSAWSTRRT